MYKKHNILKPVRYATEHELSELIYGTIHCPACDSQLMGRNLMNKMPIVDNYNTLEGWMCELCDSIFDLQDKMLDIGEFDLYAQEIAEA